MAGNEDKGNERKAGQERAARLAEQLRANLTRRKGQRRARAGDADAGADASPDDADGPPRE